MNVEFTGERFVPDKSSMKLQDDHMERYKFAGKFARGKAVLDIACGVGYGSKILFDAGASLVDGVDNSEAAIGYANQNFSSNGISFLQSDICHYTSDKKYDLIVSFETIEHIHDFRSALKNLESLLSETGELLISSPNRLITSPRCKNLTDKPKNEFHAQEFTIQELKRELEKAGFNVNETAYGQRQQRYFLNRLLKNIYREIVNPGKRFSAKVTPVKKRMPRFFVLVANKK